jgi:hypothetical protein
MVCGGRLVVRTYGSEESRHGEADCKILAGFAGWIASTTQARVAAPVNGARIDALQMMMAAGNLPTEHFVDYSLVYESE